MKNFYRKFPTCFSKTKKVFWKVTLIFNEHLNFTFLQCLIFRSKLQIFKYVYVRITT